MKQLFTIRDAIVNVLNSSKGITYYEKGKETKKTYSDIYKKSVSVLSAMNNYGITKGDSVLLQIDGIEDNITALWACILGGIIAIPLNLAKTEKDMDLIKNLCKKFEKLYLITNDSDEIMIDELQQRTLNIKECDLSGYITLQDIIKNKIDENDALFILFSSGSTGIPKGISFTNGKLHEQIDYFIQKFSVTEEDKFLNWMPINHIFGLSIYHILPMTLNADQYLISSMDYIYDPMLWSKVISGYKATILSSSNFGLKYYMEKFAEMSSDDIDFSSVKSLVVASDMISKVITDQFIEKMKKFGFQKNALCPAYGMTEATIFISYNTPDKEYEWVNIDRNAIEVGKKIKYLNNEDHNSSFFVGVGNILDILKVRIVDDDNKILEEEKVGHIQLHGKCIFNEYCQDPITTEAAFTEDKWFKTGDMGFVKENKLIITGRFKDMIICNGKNYYADDLENVVNTIPEVVNSIVFGVFDHKKMEEKIVFYIEKQKSFEDESIVKKIRTLLGMRTGLYVDEIFFTDTISRTKTGKKRRNDIKNDYIKNDDIKNDYMKNEYKILHEEDRIIDIKLSEIWMKILSVDNVSDNVNFFELGGNSIKAIQFIEEINRKLKINIKVKSIFMHPLLTDFQKYVNELV